MNTMELIDFVAPWINTSDRYYIEETGLTIYKPHTFKNYTMKRINDIYEHALHSNGDYKCVGMILHKLKLTGEKSNVFLYYDMTREILHSDKNIYLPLKRLLYDLNHDKTIADYIKRQLVNVEGS